MNPSIDPAPSALPQEAPLVAIEPGEVVLRAEPVEAESAIDYETPVKRTGWGPSIVVFVLIGLIGVLLVAAMMPLSIRSRPGPARMTAAKADIMNLETALDAFEIDNGRYPTMAEGLQSLVAPPRGALNWHGPYLKVINTDPWGMPYIYRVPTKHKGNSFDLFSYGPDKKVSKDDITNWSGP